MRQHVATLGYGFPAMKPPDPKALAVLLDAICAAYGYTRIEAEEAETYARHFRAVRVMKEFTPMLWVDSGPECPCCSSSPDEAHARVRGIPGSVRLIECPVVEAWRALGDRRAADDLERAHTEALTFHQWARTATPAQRYRAAMTTDEVVEAHRHHRTHYSSRTESDARGLAVVEAEADDENDRRAYPEIHGPPRLLPDRSEYNETYGVTGVDWASDRGDAMAFAFRGHEISHSVIDEVNQWPPAAEVRAAVEQHVLNPLLRANWRTFNERGTMFTREGELTAERQRSDAGLTLDEIHEHALREHLRRDPLSHDALLNSEAPRS